MFTMGSVLDRAVRLFENRTAIIHSEGQFTWGEFADRIYRAAGVLESLGVQRGLRFGIVSHNSFRQAELIYAGYVIGAVPVPINYRLANPEIKFILEDSSSKTLIVEDCFASILDSEELQPWAESALYVGAELSDVSSLHYESILRQATPVSIYDSAEDDDALLLYTGGTTGRSKGVRLTHRNIALNGLQISATMRPHNADVFLHAAPMFHAADLLGTAYSYVGAAHIYIAKPTGKGLLEIIEKHCITATMIPPTLIIAALQEQGFKDHDISSLRNIIYGSAPLTLNWVQRALDNFSHADIWHGYGLTETSPIVTLSHLDRTGNRNTAGYIERWGSAGQTVPGTELRIVNDEGREVATGEIAEVVVRGPQVAKGYLNLPAQTDEVFRDGWFYTGDVGRVDEAGYLFLLDRKKDIVITGGENVYTAEVESVLCSHPNVLEAAVFGIPDDFYGEAMVAALVVQPDVTITEKDIINHCRGMIGGYKIPRRVLFLPQLPKNVVGKVLKSELRLRYAEPQAPSPI